MQNKYVYYIHTKHFSLDTRCLLFIYSVNVARQVQIWTNGWLGFVNLWNTLQKKKKKKEYEQNPFPSGSQSRPEPTKATVTTATY